jgi:predicted transcriptional regulator
MEKLEITQDLLQKALRDARLDAVDFKVLIYVLLESNNLKNQQHIADELNITRESLNRATQKLNAFKYIKIQKKNFKGENDFTDMYVLHQSEKMVEKVGDDGKVELVSTIYRFIEKKKGRYTKYSLRKASEYNHFTITDIVELLNIESKANTAKIVLEDNLSSKQNCKKGEYDIFVDFFKRFFKEKFNKDIIADFYTKFNIKDVLLFLSASDTLTAESDIEIKFIKAIKAFKHKYLKETIEFYYRFFDLRDRDFYAKYNELNKNEISKIIVNKTHFMKLLEIDNRDVRGSSVLEEYLSDVGADIKEDGKYTFLETLQILKDIKDLDSYAGLHKAFFDGVFNMKLVDLFEIFGDLILI